jgi:hypothetical protein
MNMGNYYTNSNIFYKLEFRGAICVITTVAYTFLRFLKQRE